MASRGKQDEVERLRRKLEELRSFYEDLLGSLQDGVIVLDREGRVLSINQAAEELCGRSLSAARGRKFQELFPSDLPLQVLVEKTVETGRSHADYDTLLKRPDGGKLHVSAVASVLSDPKGEIRGAILVIRDLSRVRELEERLRLSDRLAALGTLAAGVAHEVRNPLAGIRGAAQLLEKEPTFPSHLKEYTSAIVKEVDRLNDLVQNLLAFAGPRRPRSIPCNIHQLLDELLALEEASLRGRGITLIKLYDPQLPPVLVDPPLIRQVFLNLLRNGAEAMPKGGELSVRTRYERFSPRAGGLPAAAVEVADQGEGIDLKAKEHLFNPFFTTKEGGTGLGLAVSLRIVEDHGGAIEVLSEEGKGTTLTVLLPLAKEKEGAG